MSRAMHRVAKALEEFAPPELEIEFVSDPLEAELVVLHTIGYPETVAAAAELEERGARFAVMQYCLRSTQQPSVEAWLPTWRRAAAVWSYYDLEQLAADDGFGLEGVPFYMAPLGVDPVFTRDVAGALEAAPRFTVLTSGYVAKTEGVLEAARATRAAGGRMYHLGPDLNLGPHVSRGLNIPDEMLAGIYRRCDFVAGLRRCEGFEMPAAEGLLCGARPVCFDRPHYRRWFEPWATFVPEATFDSTTAALLAVFEAGPGTLTDVELEAARRRFDWRELVGGFWRMAITNIEEQHHGKT